MARLARNIDPLDAMALAARPAPDRLPAMLFLAALVHGVLIIGIAFKPLFDMVQAEAISLDVTIVAESDQNIDRPDRAEYLAQTSQEGGGNTREQVRPSAMQKTDSPIDNRGSADGDSFDNASVRNEHANEFVNTEQRSNRLSPSDPRIDPQNQQRVAMALERGSEQTLPLPREDEATLRIHDDDPRQLIVSADTQASVVAHYLDNWKRRIEASGDAYFAQFAGIDAAAGSPTLEVSIHASGDLTAVVIRKSSGSAVLDEAALTILRRASPFDPFPAEIREEYDSLRFAYKWLFADPAATQTASLR